MKDDEQGGRSAPPKPEPGHPGAVRGPSLRLAGETLPVVPFAATTALGVAGGVVALFLGTPLPWLLGAVVAVGVAGLAGVRIAGSPVRFPIRLRYLFVPIIGVAIGGAFTPELIREAAGWWPTLLALLLYVPLAHAISYWVYRRLGRHDPVTAFFSAMPGGLIEAIEMGERAGADVRVLNLLQFSRLIMCILTVPLGVMLYEGMAVGSAAGLEMGGGERAMGIADAALLLAAGVVGVLAARRLRMPAAIITGPILASGAIHLAGLTEADPPAFLIALTQLVVGCGLGVRFAGMERGAAVRCLGHALASVVLVLALALVMGAALQFVVEPSAEAVLLAFAPGGVIEMSLIALSLQISVVFVSAHHVARILWTVFAAKLIHDWLRRHRGWP